MNFYGASAYQDPTMAILNAKSRALINNLNNVGSPPIMDPSLYSPGMTQQQFGSYGMNPLMPGTSLLNQNQQFGINTGLGFSNNQNMFAQNTDNACDVGKATRGFAKGLILNPLKNMLGTPQKAAVTLGTMGVAAAACSFPLTAPVAIPVCAGLALWGGIQGAIKLISGAGKAAEAASKGDGQTFEKAFEDVGEGTFNVSGAVLAGRAMKKATGNGPIDTLKASWNDGINTIKNFKPNLDIKSWANKLTAKPDTTITTSTEAAAPKAVPEAPAATPKVELKSVADNIRTLKTKLINTTDLAERATIKADIQAQIEIAKNIKAQKLGITEQPNIQTQQSWMEKAQDMTQNAVTSLIGKFKEICPKMPKWEAKTPTAQTSTATETTIAGQTSSPNTIPFRTGFDMNAYLSAGLNTDPVTAQRQMIEDIKTQVNQGTVNPALLPPELQQQLGLANDPQFKQYLNTGM